MKIVETQMRVKDLKFKTLASGDKSCYLVLEMLWDDPKAIIQLKELAGEDVVNVQIYENISN